MTTTYEPIMMNIGLYLESVSCATFLLPSFSPSFACSFSVYVSLVMVEFLIYVRV